MKKFYWALWIIITLSISGFFVYKMMLSDDKSELLIGEATHGHYQIEMACTTCHTEAFGGEDVIQNACTSCHADELKAAHDSHPKKKFNDPRNADTLEVLDARYCVTCHTEHQDEQTHAMGLTIPEDYCYHCHQEIGDERESHKDLAYDSCASAGCHNYHDNKALYERFLVENANGPWVDAMAKIAQSNGASISAPHAMSLMNKDFIPKTYSAESDVSKGAANSEHWDNNLHLEKGIGCVGCHQANEESSQQWLPKPGVNECQQCHVNEAETFKQGKHGMRLAQSMSPLTPEHSKMSFAEESLTVEHGCTSCHTAHTFDTKTVAVDACLSCHTDSHSTAFEASPHGSLAAQVSSGTLPEEQGVTCATCHMPRIETELLGKTLTVVQHNQNDNLRPNEKMIRPVCMSCHSLEFSIDALADPELIKNNFNGQPANHVPSIDWALKREER